MEEAAKEGEVAAAAVAAAAAASARQVRVSHVAAQGAASRPPGCSVHHDWCGPFVHAPLPCAEESGGGGNEDRSVWAEIWEAMRYSWTVFWNLALFLAFADVLHRHVVVVM